MKSKKMLVVMGVVGLSLLGSGSASANEIDKLTDGSGSTTTTQNSGSSSNSSSSGSSSRDTSSYGTVEPPKSNTNSHMYDNEEESSEIGDTVDSIRKELPKGRENQVLGQVQSALNKGKADAGNTARWITKPIAKWLMVIVSVIVDLLGIMFTLSTAISLFYAIAPPFRFLFDDDDVAQRNLQMTQANQGIQGTGTQPVGVFGFIRSFFKVDDDMIQSMIEADLMQGANQGSQGGGYGMQGMAYGGAYGGMPQQNPRQALHSAPRAGKHVLTTYMKKRALTLILLVLFITIFFSSLAFDYAGNIVEFLLRFVDYAMLKIQEF